MKKHYFLLFSLFLSFNSFAVFSLRDTVELSQRQGLPNFFAKVAAGDSTKVGFIGGSITNAIGWRDNIMNWMKSHYNNNKVVQVNAAIGGTTSTYAVFRIEKDLLAKSDYDLIFIEFAVNDANNDPDVERSIEGLLRKIWAKNPKTDVCFVFTVAAAHLTNIAAGKMNETASKHDSIANYYKVPSIFMGLETYHAIKSDTVSWYSPMTDLVNEKNALGQHVFTGDNTHPTTFGHNFYTKIISRSLAKMENVKGAVNHTIPTALMSNNYEKANMIPVATKQNAGMTWVDKVGVVPILDSYVNTTGHDNYVCSESSNASYSFFFTGSKIGVSLLVGPAVGKYMIEIDKVLYPQTAFDYYCSYYRKQYVTIDLAQGPHTFKIYPTVDTLTIAQKKAALRDTIDIKTTPSKYAYNDLIFSHIMIVGAITDTLQVLPVANTWYVSPTGTGDGSSWANSCSLSTALSSAASGTKIYMKKGDYPQTTTLGLDNKVLKIYGGFAGTEASFTDRSRADLDKNGIVEPWEFVNTTRILGGRNLASPSSFTVLKVTGTASDLNIDGVSIEQGLYLGAGASGGVKLDAKCTFANSIVRNCRIYNAAGNLTSSTAGGIVSTVATATIDACLIENCEAQATQSTAAQGGQCKGAGVSVTGIIQNSIVRNNRIVYDMIRPVGNVNPVYYNPYLFAAGVYLYSRSAKVANCAVFNNEVRVINWNSVKFTSAQLASIVIRGVGVASENGGSIVNCTVTNNRATVKDSLGNFISTGASAAGQGVGIYMQNGSTATNYDAYLTNTVAWGNTSTHTGVGDQQIRLIINTTSTVTPAPYFTYTNNITPATVTNLVTSPTAYFVAAGQLLDLAASNVAVSKASQFKTPSTFAGAVWGSSSQSSLDSLAIIAKGNWSPLSSSYLIGKGAVSNGATTVDIAGNVRGSVPTVGAYETLNYSTAVLTSEVPIDNKSSIYRLGNKIYNLEAGDLITVYDASGRKLESFVAVGNTDVFKSTGFVIINVHQKNGICVCLK